MRGRVVGGWKGAGRRGEEGGKGVCGKVKRKEGGRDRKIQRLVVNNGVKR